MAVVDEVHVGDKGTIFRVTITENGAAVNCTSGAVKKFIFKRPDGQVMQRDAVFFTDGSDGILQYTTVATDELNWAGEWWLQVYIELTNWQGHTSKAKFTVFKNLAA